MKLLQRLNPFYWRNKYLALSKDHNLLKELKRKSDDVAWNYRLQSDSLTRNKEELDLLLEKVGRYHPVYIRKKVELYLSERGFPLDYDIVFHNAMLHEELKASERRVSELDSRIDTLDEQNKSLSVKGEQYRIQVEDLERKNEELLAQALQLQEELDDWENVAKNLQRQLNKAEERHQQWFKLVLDFTPNDFILLNKSLWGQKIALVPEPCGLKDEKVNNDNA